MAWRFKRNGGGDTVRYAVVGLGNLAQVSVLPAFAHARENSELVALISSDDAKLSALSKRYGVAYTGSYEALPSIARAARLDAVYIALPNSMHRVATEQAAALGLHVLCETPMATTAEDGEAMVAITRAAGVRLMVGYRLHFEEANLLAIEQIRAGRIGEPRVFSTVLSHHVREDESRAKGSLGGGALLDLCVGCINAARWIFDAEPIAVQAMQGLGSGGVDEVTSAVLAFEGGRFAQMVTTQSGSDVSEYRVVGTRGDLRLDPAYEHAVPLREFLTCEYSEDAKSYAQHDQFAPEIVHFSDAILVGYEPEPSGEEGLCDLRVVEGIRASARTGHLVRLPRRVHPAGPGIQLLTKKPPVDKVEAIRARPPRRDRRTASAENGGPPSVVPSSSGSLR
jgi:predicted dehydrogenase